MTHEEMNTALTVVTPDMARHFLEKSDGNYRFASDKVVNEAVVERYAADMKLGNWKISPQGIVFDKNDRLIDGHHRLHAVIKADIPVCMSVVTNAPCECVEVLDCGERRNPYLVLNHSRGINKAAASKRGWSTARMHYDYLSRHSARLLRSVPNSEIQAFVQDNADDIETAIHCAEHDQNRIRITVNAACFYAGLCALKCGVPAETIDLFYKITTTGLYENKGQTAAIVFRNRLLERTSSSTQTYWIEVCDFAQTAMEDFVCSRPRARRYTSVRPVFTEMWFDKSNLAFPRYL